MIAQQMKKLKSLSQPQKLMMLKLSKLKIKKLMILPSKKTKLKIKTNRSQILKMKKRKLRNESIADIHGIKE